MMCSIMEMDVGPILFLSDYPFVPNRHGNVMWMLDLPLYHSRTGRKPLRQYKGPSEYVERRGRGEPAPKNAPRLVSQRARRARSSHDRQRFAATRFRDCARSSTHATALNDHLGGA